MQQFLWEIIALCITVGLGLLLLRKTPLAITDENMMRVIATDASLQSYFQDEKIYDVQALSAVHSSDKKGTLVQVLCKRLADGNSTIRLYFVAVNDNRYALRLVAESSRSLEWGNNLAFYDELKPVEVKIYSGHWVEAVYQRLALDGFNGVTLGWKVTQERIKFAIAPKQPADTVIIPVIPKSN